MLEHLTNALSRCVLVDALIARQELDDGFLAFVGFVVEPAGVEIAKRSPAVKCRA
jgi:hypothetical protein